MKKLALLFILSAVFPSVNAIAQQYTVTGCITDMAGIPIEGVKVKAVRSKTEAVTNSEGRYSIELGRKERNLSVSFSGIPPTTIPVNPEKNTEVNFSIFVEMPKDKYHYEQPDMGYYTESGKTYWVGKNDYKIEDLFNGRFGKISYNQGVVTFGRLVASTSGARHMVCNYYLIDGLQVNPEEIQNLDPRQVVSVSVYKDWADVAAYGPAAYEGVVSIITRVGYSAGVKPRR